MHRFFHDAYTQFDISKALLYCLKEFELKKSEVNQINAIVDDINHLKNEFDTFKNGYYHKNKPLRPYLTKVLIAD